MSEQDVELVAQILEAFNSEDIELILTFTHADFEVDVPAEFSTEPDVYRGHDGMRRYWDSFQDAMYAIRIRPERLWDAGGAVVAAMHLTARGRHTSITVEQRMVGVWTIRDGRAIRIRIYPSVAEALRVAGLEE